MRAALIATGFAPVFALAGCGLTADRTPVSFEMPRHGPVRVVTVGAFRDGRATMIYGTVRFPVWMEHGARRWRIDVTAQFPDGRALTRADVRLTGEMPSVTLGRRAEFATNLGIVMPAGAIVRVTPRERHQPL